MDEQYTPSLQATTDMVHFSGYARGYGWIEADGWLDDETFWFMLENQGNLAYDAAIEDCYGAFTVIGEPNA